MNEQAKSSEPSRRASVEDDLPSEAAPRPSPPPPPAEYGEDSSEEDDDTTPHIFYQCGDSDERVRADSDLRYGDEFYEQSFAGSMDLVPYVDRLSIIHEDSGEDDSEVRRKRKHREGARSGKRSARSVSDAGSLTPKSGKCRSYSIRRDDGPSRTRAVDKEPVVRRSTTTSSSSGTRETRFIYMGRTRAERYGSAPSSPTSRGAAADRAYVSREDTSHVGSRRLSSDAGSWSRRSSWSDAGPSVVRDASRPPARGARDAACYEGLSLEEYNKIVDSVQKSRGRYKPAGVSGSHRRTRTSSMSSRTSRGTKTTARSEVGEGKRKRRKRTYPWLVTHSDISAASAQRRAERDVHIGRYPKSLKSSHKKTSFLNPIYRQLHSLMKNAKKPRTSTASVSGAKLPRRPASEAGSSRSAPAGHRGMGKKLFLAAFGPPQSAKVRRGGSVISSRTSERAAEPTAESTSPRTKSHGSSSSKRSSKSAESNASRTAKIDQSNTTLPDHYSAYEFRLQDVSVTETRKKSSSEGRKLRRKSSSLESTASAAVRFMGGDEHRTRKHKDRASTSAGGKSSAKSSAESSTKDRKKSGKKSHRHSSESGKSGSSRTPR